MAIVFEFKGAFKLDEASFNMKGGLGQMKGYKSHFEAVIPSWAVDEAEGNKYLIFKGTDL